MHTLPPLIHSPVLEEVNCLAKDLYAMHGLSVPTGFKFYATDDPLAARCWNAAVVAYFNSVTSNFDGVEEAVDQYLLAAAARVNTLGDQATQLH